MKIGSIGSNMGCKQASPYFKGDSRPFIVNVHKEEDVKKELDRDNFRTDALQILRRGEAPITKLEGTYPPDVMVTGTIYYADNYEPVGDYAFGTHSYVVADEKFMRNLTIERVLNNKKDSPTVIQGQRHCLWFDTRYNKQKLNGMGIPTEPIDKADDKLLEKEGEEALHSSIKEAKENAQTDEEKAIARYREVREMRRIVERTHKEVIQEMKDLNFDYYDHNPRPLVSVPNFEP